MWKCYKAIAAHRNEQKDRQAFRTLLDAVTQQVRNGYNLEFTNPNGAIIKLTNPLPTRNSAQIQEVKQPEETKLLPAPDGIPDVVRYEDIADEIPSDKSLLGIHPEDGSLELTDWENFKAVWLVGTSSTGKSNTIYGMALQSVNEGAKLLVVDQHKEKQDSLAKKLAPLNKAFLRPVAFSDNEVLQTLQFFKCEFERRVHGASCDQKIVLICDEMNRMVRNGELKKPLQEIVAICGEESRGFGMYGWFLSQKCAGLKWLRDSAITVIVHRLTRFEEALLACNDDRAAAKQLLNFKVGRSYVYGVDFGEPMVLQQPLYRVINATTEPLVSCFQTDQLNEIGSMLEVAQEAQKKEVVLGQVELTVEDAIAAWGNGATSVRKLASELDTTYYRANILYQEMKTKRLID